MKFLSTFLFSLFITTQTLFAFPEMIKHGYVNCNACHVSPSGGALLNPYGRSLANELISTWSYKGEENFLHGAVNTESVDEWLMFGGDIRGVQVHTDSTQNGVQNIEGRYINMQSSFEVGIVKKWFTLVAAFGQYNFSDSNHKNQILPYMNKHYWLFTPKDELLIKLGRFQPQFGLNLPDHILSIKTLGMSPLQFQANSKNGHIMTIEDKQTAEVFYQDENYSLSTSVYKVLEDYTTANDKGFTFTGSKVFNETLKVGLQYWSHTNDTGKKQVYGLTGLLGWNEKWATLIEIDKRVRTPKSTTEKNDEAIFQRTAYEIKKGINLAFLTDYLQLNKNQASSRSTDYKIGPGVIWYPRPHFDFQLFATRQHNTSFDKPGYYAWLTTHYYF